MQTTRTSPLASTVSVLRRVARVLRHGVQRAAVLDNLEHLGWRS